MDTPTPTPPITAAREISVPRRTPSGLLEALEAHVLAETTSPEEARQIQGNIAHVSHGIDTRLRGGFITPEQTRDILGDKLFRGAESANALYGTNLTPDIVAQVRFKFTKGEAENALRLKTPISLHMRNSVMEKVPNHPPCAISTTHNRGKPSTATTRAGTRMKTSQKTPPTSSNGVRQLRA